MPIINKFRYIYTECGYKHGDAGKVAKAIGVSKPTISLLMNKDDYRPNIETAIRASRFFGKRIEDIWVLEE